MFERILGILVKTAYASSGTSDPPTLDKIADSLSALIERILPFGALVAVAFIILGGYMWMISGGEPNRKQLAQGTLTWAVLGLVFLFLIRMILTILINYLRG